MLSTISSSSVTIDPSLPVRGVPFESLRTLLCDIANRFPIRYSDALSIVAEGGIIRSLRNDGQPLKKSSFYHYWTALRLLGLIEQSPTARQYQLTSRGWRLIETAGPNEARLSKEEKAIFREGMLASQEIWDNFFVLFTGQHTPTQTPAIGQYVGFIPQPSQSYKKGKYRTYAIYSSCLPDLVIPDDPRISQMIVSGLRRWSQQCDLIDEIFPPTTLQAFAGITSFMYLVDTTKEAELTPTNFITILKRYQHYGQILFESTVRFSIAELLTILCLKEGLRLSTGQKLLHTWAAQHSHDVAIERPSGGLIEMQQVDRNPELRNQHQPWLDNNGFLYTTLLVRRHLFN